LTAERLRYKLARMVRTGVLVLALSLALVGCGKSRKERECEKLRERVITISAGIAEKVQRLKPERHRVDPGTMRKQMREELDRGSFMQECMKLDPDEVECLAGARTKEEWAECGYDQLMLP
jgi:hypothetical protein